MAMGDHFRARPMKQVEKDIMEVKDDEGELITNTNQPQKTFIELSC
jgi:hypothetical protein